MKTYSGFGALANCKCPRCRKGDIFPNKLLAFKLQHTNKNCPYCQLRFEREPGFWYVSMFVSYAMNVIQMIVVGVITYLCGLELSEENIWYYLGIIGFFVLLFSPFNYRYSRAILLHWLTPGLNYVPGIKKDHN